MTEKHLSKSICVNEDETTNLFPFKDIKKIIEKELVTPLVQQGLSHMSNQAYVSTSDFMKVYLRVRPLTDAEKECNEYQKCFQISKDNHILTLNAPKDSSKFKASSHGIGDKMQNFSFTKIFHPETGQKEFFDATVLKFVEDFIGGQNALLFTYGVTSSDTVCTIHGSSGNEEIMPRTLDIIFNGIGGLLAEESNFRLQMANKVFLVGKKEKVALLQEKQELLMLADEFEISKTDSLGLSVNADQTALTKLSKSRRYVMFVSFIQIYNEYIFDLLMPMPKRKCHKRAALDLVEDKASVPFVKGLRNIQVSTREEVFKLLTVGRNHIHMAETKLNQNSSRSHCIFTIKTVCTKEDGAKPLTARVSQLSFCDLAGSKRWEKTGSYGERLTEAGKIHASLDTLAKCIENLRYNQQHRNNPRLVPYRESCLTRLFQTFLKGHGKACMIVNVNQCASLFDETAHALKYSAIASEIRIPNKPLHTTRGMFFRKSKKISQHALVKSKSRPRCNLEPTATLINEEESDDDEEETEHDNAYWQTRENKLVEVIDLLQKALRDEKENCFITERVVWAELVEHMKHQVFYVEEKWEARLERELRDREDSSHKRLQDTIDYANRKTRPLPEVKEFLEKQTKNLDDKCEELDHKMDAKHEKEIKELNDKLTRAQKVVEEKESKMMENKQELVKTHEQLGRKQNELNKIKDEMEQMISDLESLQNEKEEYDSKQREEVQSLLKVLDGRIKKLKQEHEKELKDLKNTHKDIHILTMERDDLLKTAEQLKNDLTKLTKENLILKVEYEALISRQQGEVNEKKTLLIELKRKIEMMSKEKQDSTQELIEVHAKYQDLKSALNEALACAEMKNAEVEKLNTEILKTREQLSEKQKELDKIKDEKVVSNLQSLNQERQECNLKQQKVVPSLSKSTEERLEQLKQEHEKELRDLKSVHKKETLAIKNAKDEAEEARKELAIANNLEKQLMIEIERLQAEVKKLESDKLSEVQQSKKRTSETLELAQDFRILAMERDDLLKTTESLKKNLSTVRKENMVLENNKSTPIVAGASELATLKVKLNKMDNTRTKNEALIHRQQTEIDKKKTLLIELEEKIEMLSKAKQDLTLEVAEIGEPTDSESLRSEITLALSERDQEIKAPEAKLLLQERELRRLNEKMKENDQKIETLRQELDAIDDKSLPSFAIVR